MQLGFGALIACRPESLILETQEPRISTPLVTAIRIVHTLFRSASFVWLAIFGKIRALPLGLEALVPGTA